MQSSPPKALSVLVAGLLPVIAFTVIEEYYGTMAGLIAGLVFGVGEVAYEYFRYKKVSKITWIGNGLLLGLGALSLISSDGIWFKLQPAIFEALFAIAIWISLLIGKNLFVVMAEQQGTVLPEILRAKMGGLAFRVGVFFAGHAILAVWAAYTWSTTAWALLKGVGVTVSFIVYLVVEMVFIRLRMQKK